MTEPLPTPRDLVAALWREASLGEAPLDRLTLTGAEPVLPSSFRVDALAQAVVAASGLAAAEIARRAGGAAQTVSVDIAHAANEFRSERHLRVDGRDAPELWDALAGVYHCGDGRFVRLHTNFPHHRKGVVDLLECADTREGVAGTLQRWRAEDFETAASERGLVVAMMRSFAEWDGHPHAPFVAAQPLVDMARISDSPPRPLPAGPRPLEGLRVLDLTRIIAGPVCGRTLAAHGATVLSITGPHLPFILPAVMDTGRGKLRGQLDLRTTEGRAALAELARTADVFVQGYRPGGLAELGFAPEDLARLNPSIVCVSLTAYGVEGPWSGKRGFDSLVQTATGFNHAEAEAAGETKPRALPCQALDHGAGYLMAFAVMAALMRRAQDGGAWRIRVSLARTALWLRGLGRLPNGLATREPTPAEVAPFLEQVESGFGRLTSVRHAAVLSRTPAMWTRPSMPLGAHPPRWPD
ncbi:MAG: CoA transferase [Rhizobiales bacterium]|nr:CoA transferase [Hyphomicrobiales bacterium]